MIYDPNQISIAVTVDESVVDPGTSLAFGLIITKLVINALKHACPGHRHRLIAVRFRSQQPQWSSLKEEKWSLSVTDDGVGIPFDGRKPRPGLGTGIVEARAGQLGGVINMTDANPGLLITVGN
jgi:two-component sensor histidine kinase